MLDAFLAMLALFGVFRACTVKGLSNFCRMTRQCRFGVWDARYGLKPFLDGNIVIHRRCLARNDVTILPYRYRWRFLAENEVEGRIFVDRIVHWMTFVSGSDN